MLISVETKKFLLALLNDTVIEVTGESPEHQQRLRVYSQKSEITLDQATDIADAFKAGKWLVIWEIVNRAGLIECPDLEDALRGTYGKQ